MSVAVQMAPGAPTITSASGLIAMLEEDQLDIKAYALTKLNAVVDDFWAEIADCLPDIEALYEDDSFKSRELAALVASKVYFQLGELDDALTYALGAGSLFDVSGVGSEYVDTLLAKCIDEYCQQHVRATEGKPVKGGEEEGAAGSPADIDARLVELVERMFDSCFDREQYKQVLGIAIESRRLDVIYRALTRERLAGVGASCTFAEAEAAAAAAAEAGAPVPDAGLTPHMLEHCLDACKSAITSREFRTHVLRLLVSVFRRLPSPDYLGLCECLTRLGDVDAVAATMTKLADGTDREFLLACQVAFDLVENGSQSFVAKVGALVHPPPPPPPAAAAAPPSEGAPAAEGGAAPPAEPMAVDAAAAAAAAPPAAPAAADAADAELTRRAKLGRILTGVLPIHLHLEFLCRNNKTDLALLSSMKAAVEPRNALCHSAIVLAHSLMSAGTTADTFLRDNLEWLARATNWSKFVATATLGVIHRGHMTEAMRLLQPYLPTQGISASPFSEGGALYALGLIHANHGASVRDFLLGALRNAGSNETVLHGACLGLGLACMATEDAALYDELKGVLYNDSAVAGEAAAFAMGLVMAGSGSARASEEMVAYAHDTQHEKIIRALSVSLGVVFYGREEEADGMITQLLLDKDDILRYGGAYTLALAYAGTSNNSAIRRVLDIAVSDVSDNVRRGAVTALGFILANAPAQCPKVVALLAESYNPHVRYGATMAVGVACAGTGLRDAIEMLHKMSTDSVEYVRQGALIASAMVLLQSSPQGPESRAGQLRKQLEKVVSDKHEDAMTRFGAILASGILEAGGRNVTIQLMSQRGHKKLPAFVGMAIFTNFWFWHPLVPFISLAFSPTALIGLNSELRMPKWSFASNAPPSSFAYPPAVKPDAKSKVDKVATAVLSTTAKAKRSEKAKDSERRAKDKEGGGAAMDVDGGAKEGSGKAAAPAAADEPGAPKEKTPKEKEPPFQLLSNPARVLPQQEAVLTVQPDSRYAPVVQGPSMPTVPGTGAPSAPQLLRHSGFVMLEDLRPGEPQELLEPSQTGGTAVPADMEEPAPPAPFEFSA